MLKFLFKVLLLCVIVVNQRIIFAYGEEQVISNGDAGDNTTGGEQGTTSAGGPTRRTPDKKKSRKERVHSIINDILKINTQKVSHSMNKDDLISQVRDLKKLIGQLNTSLDSHLGALPPKKRKGGGKAGSNSGRGRKIKEGVGPQGRLYTVKNREGSLNGYGVCNQEPASDGFYNAGMCTCGRPQRYGHNSYSNSYSSAASESHYDLESYNTTARRVKYIEKERTSRQCTCSSGSNSSRGKNTAQQNVGYYP
ncbi:MAG: hypothetical protein LBS14_03155 [Holosporaceae bacterium]|jgi:hypothetical protein|nr:hypothetical protein [Holosporaceae bacterium]